MGLVLVVSTSRAGDWHFAAGICTDCHTIHNSQAGAPMRFDGSTQPAVKLLRAAGAEELCLYCHDGGFPSAPDVIDPVVYVPDAAAGYLLVPGVANPNGHDISVEPGAVPPGGSVSMVLTCTSCHDPHGTPGYRNLLLDPPGPDNPGDVIVQVDQQVTADGSNPALVYIPSNLTDKSGFSAWCNDCHGDFHGRTASEEGVAYPWLRHPQEEPMVGSQGAAGAHWLGPITNRVRAESPTDAVIPSADDQVFCLSCHKAHGSGRPSALISADGSSILSTCEQCHDM